MALSKFDDAISTLYAICFNNSAKLFPINYPNLPSLNHFRLEYKGYVRFGEIDGILLSEPHEIEDVLEERFKPFLYDCNPEDKSFIIVRELLPNQLKKLKKQLAFHPEPKRLFWLEAQLRLMEDPYKRLSFHADNVKGIREGYEFDLD